MNRPHFRRRPRPTDPEPYTRLDRLDGLPQRASGGTIAAGGMRVIAAGERVYHLDGRPGRNRYDAEWPDVRAAEAGGWAGGDLAAMAAPADWPPFSGWGEGYEIEPETRIVIHPQSTQAKHTYAIGDAIAEVVAAMRAAETDLRADGRAYEAGRRARTEAAAMRHARAALDDRTRGARDAAWILAGHVGVTP